MLLSELLHDLLCNLPTYYNLSKIDSLSLRLSSTGHSLVISATRITNVLDYSGAAISFILYYLFYSFSIFKEYANIIPSLKYLDKYDSYTCIIIYLSSLIS
jgi:hypothetical protein